MVYLPHNCYSITLSYSLFNSLYSYNESVIDTIKYSNFHYFNLTEVGNCIIFLTEPCIYIYIFR